MRSLPIPPLPVPSTATHARREYRAGIDDDPPVPDRGDDRQRAHPQAMRPSRASRPQRHDSHAAGARTTWIAMRALELLVGTRGAHSF